jgi:phosphotriesterase-related protein
MGSNRNKATIQTVLGPIASTDLGPCLIHEHLLVDFVGADKISRQRYSQRRAVHKLLPLLHRLELAGIRSFVDCTPAYLGRDPGLLASLAKESGLHIVTNTGFYAAGERRGNTEPFLPEYAFRLSAEELAGGWLKEWYEGIEGTPVKPGFLKIGVNPGPLRDISRKMVRAAALTSRKTGLAIACHTVSAQAAKDILDILDEEKVSPTRFIYVHAQGEPQVNKHLLCAKKGAWIEYDGISEKTASRDLDLIRHMLENGFEDQLLISQDAGWFDPGKENGGDIRGYGFLPNAFVPLMLESGIPEATVQHLLVHNPARALGISA